MLPIKTISNRLETKVLKKIATETLEATSKLPRATDWEYLSEEDANRPSEVMKMARVPSVSFTQATTAAAIRDFGSKPVVALNFASARHPGGGFMKGAVAQEEDICRKSSLYHSLVGCEDFYKDVKNTLYTDRIIYSPTVYFIRDENHNIVDPVIASIITCAAPNNCHNWPTNVLKETFERRIDNVLKVAEEHGHDTIVLGAWGCGAFGNSPNLVANAFKQVITRYSFEEIVFAIPDDLNLSVFKNILS